MRIDQYYAGTTPTGAPLSGGAPADAGTYTVVANFGGSTDYSAAAATATFVIAPATPTVSVADGGTYNGAPFLSTVTIAGVGGAPVEGVTASLTYYAGSTTTGAPLSGPPTGAGTYTVVAGVVQSSDYSAAAATATFVIAPATPTVSVADAGGTYNGAPFAATATVAGVSNTPGSSLENVSPSLAYYSGTYTTASQLTGLTPLNGAPIQAGSYTVVASFGGSTDYSGASSAPATFAIDPAILTVSVADGGTYNGAPFLSTVTIAGVGGAPVEGVTASLTYYAGSTTTGAPLSGPPTGAGTYTVVAGVAQSSDYSAAAATATFVIAPATPTVSVADAGGTYNGAPFAATATVAGVSNTPGSSLENVSPSLAYYNGTYTSASQLTGLTPLTGAPIQAGSYTVVANFGGSPDYSFWCCAFLPPRRGRNRKPRRGEPRLRGRPWGSDPNENPPSPERAKQDS